MTDTSNLTPEKIAEIQQSRRDHWLESSQRFLERGKPHLEEAEKNLFKINAGGIIATLALIGQAIPNYPGLAGLLVLPALGFTVSLLSALLLSYMRAQEFSDYSRQLQHFALNLPEDFTETPKPASTAPNSIRKLSQISGIGFCTSVIAAVILSAVYAMHASGVWSKIVGMFEQLL